MADEHVERKLAAILAADVTGYSRLMGEDEAGTRARFNVHEPGPSRTEFGRVDRVSKTENVAEDRLKLVDDHRISIERGIIIRQTVLPRSFQNGHAANLSNGPIFQA